MCLKIFKIYAVLYAFAVLIWLMGTYGWLGAERDPLSGVFLIIMGQPWVLLVDYLPEPLWTMGGVLAPALNTALIYFICFRIRRSR